MNIRVINEHNVVAIAEALGITRLGIATALMRAAADNQYIVIDLDTVKKRVPKGWLESVGAQRPSITEPYAPLIEASWLYPLEYKIGENK